MNKAKPYKISKENVWKAYKQVKANGGAAGVDGQTITEFGKDLKDNLYKIWNRMSSGSYFPPAVKAVEIPKGDGKKRILGVPTVSDRIAQMVVKLELEPQLEPYFHEDSYGYRPGKSAIEAIEVTRKRCWSEDWVIDLDIKGFFDNLDHELVMKALRRHTNKKWIHLYVSRWLKAEMKTPDGRFEERRKGTPQGGVVSPILANLFLHYAFDEWMRRNYPNKKFERYCDDIVVHCKSEKDAKQIKKQIEMRLKECRLELHPEKTKVVYCKDSRRRKDYRNQRLDFLGYTFQAREARNRKGDYFVGFLPAVSKKAKKNLLDKVRGKGIHLRSELSIEEISKELNPIIRGWINYFNKFYKSAINHTCLVINRMLIKWAMRKYKKLRGKRRKATRWLKGIAQRQPQLFAMWKTGILWKAEQ